MFKPQDVNSKTATISDNDSKFILYHGLVTEEHHLLSDQKEEICDRQREWLNANAQGLDLQDKKNLKWIGETLKAHTSSEIIPSFELTWSDF